MTIAVLAASSSVALAAYGCADRFILPPVGLQSGSDGSARLEIPFKDGILEVFCARSPGARIVKPEAFVLRFTGDANHAARFTASRWRDRPVEAWVVNYPGYGGSSGPRTLSHLADAALTAYDAMRIEAGERPVFLEGFSLGTVPALHVAANRPVAGLILQNPPSVREIVLAHGWWNLWLIAAPVAYGIPVECDSPANARKCGSRALFLVAEKDRAVPPENQRLVFEAYAGMKRQIVQVGADHADPLDESTEQMLQEGITWLMRR